MQLQFYVGLGLLYVCPTWNLQCQICRRIALLLHSCQVW